MKAKVLVYDVKTKKQEIVEQEIPEMPSFDFKKPLDPDKVKNVLLNAGLIADISEVEA